jgi:hypothetical protein
VIVLSFVWAFLPFKFTMTVYAAIDEMHTASAMCAGDLLLDTNQRSEHDNGAASAESVLQRVLSHVAAAGVTSGRSAEVYGLVFPVSALHIIIRATPISLFLNSVQINIAFNLAIIATNLNMLRDPTIVRVCVRSSCEIEIDFCLQNETGFNLLGAVVFWMTMRCVAFFIVTFVQKLFWCRKQNLCLLRIIAAFAALYIYVHSSFPPPFTIAELASFRFETNNRFYSFFLIYSSPVWFELVLRSS